MELTSADRPTPPATWYSHRLKPLDWVALYVACNLMFVGFAPILHDLEVQLTVRDVHGRPVADAQVSWIGSSDTPIGCTDAFGELKFSQTVQEQPYWLLPPIGSFRLSGLVLRVRADGFASSSRSLADPRRDIWYIYPYAQRTVTLRAQ